MKISNVLLVAGLLLFGAIAMPNVSLREKFAGVMLSRVPANVVGALREKTLGAKALKATTGWSLLDQDRYGFLGDSESVFNDPCGTFCNAVFGVTWTPPWRPKPLDHP